MTARRLLLLPLLSPLLSVLLVGALNPSPQVSFRVLTWQTPRAPLGFWLGGAALAGAALSGAGTALALRQAQGAWPRGRRRVSTPASRPWAQGWSSEDSGWEAVGESSTIPPWREELSPEPRRGRANREGRGDGSWRDPGVAVAPPRSPGDPPPTVDVPFRILHRVASPSQQVRSPSVVAEARPGRASEPATVGVEDDWGSDAGEDW